MAPRLMREEGIWRGISCGAATVAALRSLAARSGLRRPKRSLWVLPEFRERFLSSVLFEWGPSIRLALALV